MDLSNFHLTFDNEFNSFGNWDTTIFGSRTLSRNGGQEFYSDSSVGVNPFTMENGELTITAAPNSSLPHGLSYTSGIITSLGRFSQEYGYFEMRAELPQGAGMWPGFWLIPESKVWPPEIDVLEAFGAKAADGQGGSNMVHVNAISTVPGESGPAWIGIPGNIYNSYHTYGVDWEPNTITYYIDGQAVSQIKTPDDMHQKMFMIANISVGGSWPGYATGETGHMKIDYIRAYSTDANIHAVAQQTISSPDGANTTPSALAGSTTGPGTIVLHVSGDHTGADPKFSVSVDGKPVGGIQTVTAIHSIGQWQDITVHGNFGTGAHTVDVDFINDAIGRNMYVQSITVNGEHIAGTAGHNYADSGLSVLYDKTAAALLSAGSVIFDVPAAGQTTTTSSSSSSSTSTGTDTLTLHVSEDAWNGNAQFTVSVDGHQVGGTQTATATHALGQWQDITLHGNFGTGTHTVDVNFINDAWGGTSSTDRNLYVQYVDLDGVRMSGADAHNNASNGKTSTDGSAVMHINGTAEFHPPASTTSTITLHVSEDAWSGNAQFVVKVDGHQIGDVQTATANHAAGQIQNVTLTGDFGSLGPDKIDVSFLNDAYGGSKATDRNLYVSSIDVNGVNFSHSAVTANTANTAGWLDPNDAHSTLLANNGTATFDINHTAPPSDWHV